MVQAAAPSPVHLVQVVALPTKLYPLAQVEATVAEVQVKTPVPQDVQDPELKKYPDEQAVATVALVQVEAPVEQAAHAPLETKYPVAQAVAINPVVPQVRV